MFSSRSSPGRASSVALGAEPAPRRAGERQRPHPAGRFHARQRGDVCARRVVVRKSGIRGPRRWQLDGREQRVLGGEAEVRVERARDALDEQPRADEQHAGDADLRADERAAHPSARAIADVAAVRAQRGGQWRTDRADRRQHADQQRRERRDAQRVGEDVPAGRRVEQRRLLRRKERGQHVGRPRGEQQADSRGREREHGGLGQQLPQQPARSRAERAPDRDLAAARRRAGGPGWRHWRTPARGRGQRRP